MDESDPRLAPAANAFGPAAANYERARPEYPAELLTLLQDQVGIGPRTQVLDLAAGTGKLTRLIEACGAPVVAVEPVAGMRAQLEEVLPGVEVLDGTAEAIPLPDSSMDVVTVGQAFHWFDFAAAFSEIRRVLRPGGALAILFNERDARTAWVAEWNRVIEWHSRTIAVYQNIDWSSVLENAGFAFGGEAHVEWNQTMTPDLIASRVRSVSYIASEPEPIQRDYVARVLALVEDFGPTFCLPYVAHLWWGRKRP